MSAENIHFPVRDNETRQALIDSGFLRPREAMPQRTTHRATLLIDAATKREHAEVSRVKAANGKPTADPLTRRIAGLPWLSDAGCERFNRCDDGDDDV